MKVIVIGGGAAGMMAAISASRHGADVTLLEANQRLGKKLSATGNGRCNYTNLDMTLEKYRGKDPEFIREVLSGFTVPETLRFFQSLGIEPRYRESYVYPYSDQASSMVYALMDELVHRSVRVETGQKARSVKKSAHGFMILTEDKDFACERLILAAGSCAVPSFGSDGSGYTLAKQFGHTLIPTVPALVALKCKEAFYPQLAGVRVRGGVILRIDGEAVARDTGELQLVKYGISGIPVFQVSRYASYGLKDRKTVTAELSFFPDKSREELLSLFLSRRENLPYKETAQFFLGLLNNKLAEVLLKQSGIALHKKIGELQDGELRKLAGLCTGFPTVVTGTNGFDNAQCAAGGISAREVNPRTLESRKVPGLYFAGELLDVDGICGGYNLQWAWSSGYLAGKAAAGNDAGKDRVKKEKYDTHKSAKASRR